MVPAALREKVTEHRDGLVVVRRVQGHSREARPVRPRGAAE